MEKAVFAWIATFAMSAMLARGAASRMAFQMTIPFPSYDEQVICRRIRGRVFTSTWLICAIVSSTSVAGAMLADEAPALLLIAFGMFLITVQTFVQGYRLFRVVLADMGLPWPPPSKN